MKCETKNQCCVSRLSKGKMEMEEVPISEDLKKMKKCDKDSNFESVTNNEEDLDPEILTEMSIESLDGFEWLDKLFPEKKKRIILNDEDLITEEMSDKRIIWFEIILGILQCVIFLIQIILITIATQKHTFRIYTPEVIDPFEMSFPFLHLAIVKGNGTVIDFSLNEKHSQSKGMLAKLPLHPVWDFGYATPKGILYFIDSSLNHEVLKYHSSLKHNGLAKITTSNEDKCCWYKVGFEIGGIFWLLGMTPIGEFNYGPTGIIPGSKFWFKRKERLVTGPNLPHNFVLTEATSICGTGYNRSSGFVIGGYSLGVALFDVLSNQWTHYTDLPFYSDWCSCTLTFRKKENEK